MKTQGLFLALTGLPLAFSLPASAPSSEAAMISREITNAQGKMIKLLLRDSFTDEKIEKRDVTFPSNNQPVAFNGDQCGESSFELTGDDDAEVPNYDDCNDLANGLSGLDRHWELNNGYGGYVKDWLLLASVDTCKFYVNRKNFPDATTDGKVLVGTTDLADLTRDSVTKFQKWGTVTYPGGSLQVGTVIPATGNMGCFPNSYDTPWRIQANQP